MQTNGNTMPPNNSISEIARGNSEIGAGFPHFFVSILCTVYMRFVTLAYIVLDSIDA